MNERSRNTPDSVVALRQATMALALELPSSVWDDYTAKLDAVLSLLPDPRIARIEALCDEMASGATATIRLRSILRGDE